MKIIDTRGMKCPKPIIMAKKALKESNFDEQLKVITDNETSYANLMSFFRDNKFNAEPKNEGDFYSIIVSKAEKDIISGNEAEYCSAVNPDFNKNIKRGCIVVIKSLQMGRGDDILGIMLLEGFINALKDADVLPEKIILYNEGVKLAVNDSPVIDSLKEIENKGVSIMSCGTCIDFYKLKDMLAVGTITNMSSGAEMLINAENIIYP
jgi:selenium metabolism protein YedF